MAELSDAAVAAIRAAALVARVRIEVHRGGGDRLHAQVAPGEALADQGGQAEHHGGGDLDALQDHAVGEGVGGRDPEAGVKNDFAQDLTPTEKSILFAAQAPTAAAAFGASVSVASWKAKPSWYLVATADRAIPPSLERAMAKAINAETVEIASSHVAMLARPEEAANLVLEAAGRASRSNVGLKSA